MSDIDKDLQRRLRDFADGISPEPGRSAVVVRSARTKRRLVALSAALAVMIAVGGLAGAATLLDDRDRIRPAPGPEETTECVSADYDLALFIEDAATESEIQTLRETLVADTDVDHVTFMSKKAAFEEFKNHYADQPEFWENLPEDALPMSFRVKVVDDAEIDTAAGRFKTLDHVEGVRSRGDLSKESRVGGAAPDCPSDTLARYFFEAGSRDASASGFLVVNSEEGTLCYEATTENIQASHLLRNTGVVAGGRRFERTIVVTFLDPGDGEQGAELRSGAPICFQEEQLAELKVDLQVLIDHPEDFRVSFQRGPEDEPGLIAKLRESRSREQGRADYYIEESRGFGVHVPKGWNVAQRPLTPHLGDPQEIVSLGTGPMTPGGSCAHQPARALEALDSRDAFISIQERRGDVGHPARPRSFQEKLQHVLFNIEICADLDDVTPYWFAFRDAGRDFHLLAALGTKASAKRAHEFWKVLDSLDFEPPYDD